MLEALVVATAATGLFALAKGIKGNQIYRVDRGLMLTSREERADDLPCPWCYAPTNENDTRCSGCGQLFG